MHHHCIDEFDELIRSGIVVFYIPTFASILSFGQSSCLVMRTNLEPRGMTVVGETKKLGRGASLTFGIFPQKRV
ncbi:MAG: hypothetical protein LBD28_01800 [Tannerellaceae bacterium]|jgi:hypothetical protein|nr:hypothetical protein [Tannerellaceae bacterium]